MDNNEETNPFEAWAIVELMGHVKLAGRVTEEEHFGHKLGRIDIPYEDEDGTPAPVTQYFGGQSLYRLTPTTEEVCRAYMRDKRPRPVQAWELRLPAPEPDLFWEDEEEEPHDPDEDVPF